MKNLFCVKSAFTRCWHVLLTTQQSLNGGRESSCIEHGSAHSLIEPLSYDLESEWTARQDVVVSYKVYLLQTLNRVTKFYQIMIMKKLYWS